MATLSRMMKKAASSVISVANLTHRNYNSSVVITPLKTSTIYTSGTNKFREVFRTASFPRYFSDLAKTRSNSEEMLIDVIETEIDRAEEEFDVLEVAGVPNEFPFKIVDNAEEQIVTLTREYQGELIEVTVLTPDVSHEYLDEDQKRLRKKCQSSQQYVNIFVSVTKKSRPTARFHVAAGDADERFTIISFALKNTNAIDFEGVEFWRLDKNMKEGFYSYLEVRGIKPSLTKFLYNYMVRREHKKYTEWMKNLKSLIAN